MNRFSRLVSKGLLAALFIFGLSGCRSSIGYTRTGGVFRSNDHLAWNEFHFGTTFGAPEVQPEPVIQYSHVYYSDAAPPAMKRSTRDRVEEEPELPSFDPTVARTALNAIDVSSCRDAGAPAGFGHARIVLNPDGRISKVVVDEPANMSGDAAKCIGDRLGAATVPPFKGSLVTIGTTFHVR